MVIESPQKKRKAPGVTPTAIHRQYDTIIIIFNTLINFVLLNY